MTQELQSDLMRQVVLFNGSFGPREIDQLVEVVASGYGGYRTLREAVAELEAREEPSPA